MIQKVALSFVGQREKPNNMGFMEPRFEEMMKQTGWRKGQAWCAFFAELVWMRAGLSTEQFSGGAVQTFKNFNQDNEIPDVGDVVIWQTYRKGKPRWTGHAGIVVAWYGNQIITVEGNTNSHGGREGIEVALRIRNLNFKTNNGLRMLGFIKSNLLT
jgi:hypothetical protein